MTYTFKKSVEIIRKKIGYEISEAVMHEHKRNGHFVSCKVIHRRNMNRFFPVYNDESISNFVEFYKNLVATGKTLQWRSKKHTA